MRDLSISQFRRAAQIDGNLRFEQQGTGVKLVSAKKSLWGRIVSWFKGLSKAEKAENKKIMISFRKALCARYGNVIGSRAFNAFISEKQLEKGKPLSAYTVRKVLAFADEEAKKVSAAVKNFKKQKQQLLRLINKRMALRVTSPRFMDKLCSKIAGAKKTVRAYELFSYSELKKVRKEIMEAIESSDKKISSKEAVRIAAEKVKELQDRKIEELKARLPSAPTHEIV